MLRSASPDLYKLPLQMYPVFTLNTSQKQPANELSEKKEQITPI